MQTVVPPCSITRFVGGDPFVEAKNVHDIPGGNYRLDPLQAAILGAKLPHYEARLARRQANAASLRQGKFDGDVTLVNDEPGLPYPRPPLSKAYLAGAMEEPALALRLASFTR